MVRVPSHANKYHLRHTNRVPLTMGTLSLCTDSAQPPGTSTMPSPSPSGPTSATSSLHVISDSTCHLSSAAQTPTQPPPAIHHRLFAIANLWLRVTRHLGALILLSLLLGLVISWIPLTTLLLSTLFVSICLTAEELDDIIPKPTRGHKSDTLPTPDNTPSWPWKLAPLWSSLNKLRITLPRATLFTSRPWLPLTTFLRPFTLSTTCFPSWPSQKTKRNQTKTPQRRQRQHYPLTKPPGTCSKHGKQPTVWTIVYDPTKDEILTWSNAQIHIYR